MARREREFKCPHMKALLGPSHTYMYILLRISTLGRLTQVASAWKNPGVVGGRREKRFMLHMNTPNDIRQAAVQSWQWRSKRDIQGMIQSGWIFSSRTTFKRQFAVKWSDLLGFMPLSECARLPAAKPAERVGVEVPAPCEWVKFREQQ